MRHGFVCLPRGPRRHEGDQKDAEACEESAEGIGHGEGILHRSLHFCNCVAFGFEEIGRTVRGGLATCAKLQRIKMPAGAEGGGNLLRGSPRAGAAWYE